MNEVCKQQLSALLDDELGADETRFLLRRIEADRELAQLWSRYQLMGDALRGGGVPMSASFNVRVMRQIDTLPVAPRSEPAAVPTRRAGRWLRYGLGGSLAASVAVAALVWMQPRPLSPATPMAAAEMAVARDAPRVAQVPVKASAEMAVATPDLGALLRLSDSPYLDVRPASAVRRGSQSILVLSPEEARLADPRARQRPETFLLHPRPAPRPPNALSQRQTLRAATH